MIEFKINDPVIWDSHFGYEVGYFLGEGVMFNTYLVDVKSGKIQEPCSYSTTEVHAYTEELLTELSAKYGYVKKLDFR